jgi:hypothetical protein
MDILDQRFSRPMIATADDHATFDLAQRALK